VGKSYDVLIDGPSRRRPDEWAGRTDGNTIVNIAWPADGERPSNPLGQTIRARVTEAGPNTLKGVPC
jgi:tRNA-2-methylthio-N6-dimethylallyladenosine synthase